jgi:hypothetical protein
MFNIAWWVLSRLLVVSVESLSREYPVLFCECCCFRLCLLEKLDAWGGNLDRCQRGYAERYQYLRCLAMGLQGDLRGLSPLSHPCLKLLEADQSIGTAL